MDKDFAPLVDVTEVTIEELRQAAPDSKMAQAMLRLWEDTNDDSNVLSAFQSNI